MPDTTVVLRALRGRITHGPSLALLDALEASRWDCADVRAGGIVVFNHPMCQEERPTPEYMLGSKAWPFETYFEIRGVTVLLHPRQARLCSAFQRTGVPWAGTSGGQISLAKAVEFVCAEVVQAAT